MKYQATHSLWNRLVSICLLCLCMVIGITPLAGCSTTSETIALSIAGAAGGTVVGSQIANRSELSVTVDVYIPNKSDLAKFQLDDQLVLKKQIEQMKEGNLATYWKVGKQLRMPMTALIEQAKHIDTLYKNLQSFRTPGPELSDTLAEFKTWTEALTAAEAKWIAYDSYLNKVQAKGSATNTELNTLSAKLNLLRKLLDQSFVIPDSYYLLVAQKFGECLEAGVQQAMTNAGLDASQRNAINNIRYTDTTLKKRYKAILSNPSLSDKEKLANIIAVTVQIEFDLTISSLGDDTQKKFTAFKKELAEDSGGNVYKAISDGLKSRGLFPPLSDLGLELSDQHLSKLLRFESAKQRSAFIQSLETSFALNEEGEAVFSIESIREQAYRATYSALLVDVNFGPILNEVMQNVMTPEAISVITRPGSDNQKKWQRFATAKSTGQTGNHDVLVYFENMGKPILKSSKFDPTKFVVANGQAFQRVFYSLADVYGLPTGAADGVKADTNLAQLKQNRDKALEAAKKDRQKLIASMELLLSASDFTKDDVVKAKLKEAADNLKPEAATDQIPAASGAN